MKLLYFYLFSLTPLLLLGQTESVSVIPQPNKVISKDDVYRHNGEFTLSTSNQSLQQLVAYTTVTLKEDFNWNISFDTTNDKANLQLVLEGKNKSKEGYRLVVDKKGIKITASTEQGLFYGLQTLRQLVNKKDNSSIEYVEIEDAPRFGWRAFMLDEGRYFQGKKQVMKLLDEMARLKMNIFHWHLVDDQGWRIEIKKYPLLTEIGSKRTSSQIGPRKWESPIQSGEPHEGFYTQNEIKEIIEYAEDRHIKVVPEIEMPGHASAAIAAYPWLGSSGEKISTNIPILPGELWWGGAVNDGFSMPYQEGFSYNMYGDNKGNQVQPLLISNKGRVIWSERPFQFSFLKNAIEIQDAKGEILKNKAGKTLKEAFEFASSNYFPADGNMPHELLFTAPQYNTWIELMYNQNQKDILAYAHAIIDNGFPPGVLMIDDNWQEDYGKWNFHPGRFPDPKKMMEELHSLGFKVMLWVCPFVSPDSDVYRDLAKDDLFLKNPENATIVAAPWIESGQPAMIYWWNGVSAVLDLSNPKAEVWFKGELNNLMEKFNVDGFKLDAGDFYFYPDNLISHKEGTSPNEHSALFGKIGLDYPLNEYRAMWKMAGKPLAQRLSDKAHNWEDLQMLIPNITGQGLMGYAFSCPDMIGGGEFSSFLNTETIDQELIVRSAQVHALMPMMQFSVAPWRILDKEHLNAVKQSVELRKKFVPYIMALAKKAAQTGKPIVRTMEYEFPNQGFENLKDQFLLGDKVLIAPVLKKGITERTVQLPKGRWKSATGETYRGGRTITIEIALTTLPYFEKISN